MEIIRFVKPDDRELVRGFWQHFRRELETAAPIDPTSNERIRKNRRG